MKVKQLTKEQMKNFAKRWVKPVKSHSLRVVESKTIKPIFTIGMCSASLTQETLKGIRDALAIQMPEYHVLMYSQNTSKDPIFQVFYEKDFKVDEFEKLKKQILTHLNNNEDGQ